MQGAAHRATNTFAALLFPYHACFQLLDTSSHVLITLTMGLGILLAARLPDQVEYTPLFITHRGWSHCWMLWAGLAIAPHIWWNPQWPIEIAWFLSGLGIGALYHILADIWDRGGIPLIIPGGPSIKLKLYSTGKSPAFLGVGIMVLLQVMAFLWLEVPFYSTHVSP